MMSEVQRRTLPPEIVKLLNSRVGPHNEEVAGPVWIFGYGSIIWKAGFHFTQRKEGFIRGYHRAFHQGSTDHRGTKEFPGRTVTLVPAAHDVKTWGVAYCIEGSLAAVMEAMEYLEWREKQYDIRLTVPFYERSNPGTPAVTCLLYIASPDKSVNENFLGPAPLPDIAWQIAHARGPSGPNYEYLYMLADSLRDADEVDEEVFELEALVKRLLEREDCHAQPTSSMIDP
eukprot:jgi/Mesvir1/14169/Mv09632-RA.1